MKWGQLYGPKYVNRLYAMVRRQTTGDLRFVCLTDDREGICAEIECLDCPMIDLPENFRNKGWRKLSLYRNSKHMFGLKGVWLYLDLDVVVTGGLDVFFEHSEKEAFIVMQNWTQPGSGIGNTSVFRFEIGKEQYLHDDLIKYKDKILADYPNSQTYVSRNLRKIAFWPDEWCVLFKVQCVPAWPFRFWREPKLPLGARIVAFPGVPNPHEAERGYWPVKTPWKKIYKTIRPATWISDFWRESF